VLKDDPPEQLIGAVRTVAAGDALLSPAITKRVIKQFTRIPRPAPPKELDELTAREHDILRLIAEGPVQRRDRTTALHQRDDRQDARHPHPPEARPPRPGPGRRARLPGWAHPAAEGGRAKSLALSDPRAARAGRRGRPFSACLACCQQHKGGEMLGGSPVFAEPWLAIDRLMSAGAGSERYRSPRKVSVLAVAGRSRRSPSIRCIFPRRFSGPP